MTGRNENTLSRIRSIVSSPEDRVARAKQLAEVIMGFGGYRWVGIYDVGPESVRIIAWSGSGPPAYPTFPITKGLTGSAIKQRAPVVVGDVRKDPRYLTTFSGTLSEIIIPVLNPQEGSVVGTIDVESEHADAFSDRDREVLEQCAGAALPLWGGQLRAMTTVFDQVATCGLGEIRINHPPGAFAPTPASFISVYAIGKSRGLLRGNGIDWGSGSGCLAIAAAKVATVEKVLGLEITAANLEAAIENVALNGVTRKVEFFLSDSYRPISRQDQERLLAYRGKIDFVLANPPASDAGDGFEYRREVLKGAKDYLRPGGLVLLSISYQYGLGRIRQLECDVPGFKYCRVLATTDWEPFDLSRPDLLACLRLYAQVEGKGGAEYTFRSPNHPKEQTLTAKDALKLFEKTRQSPLSRWQTHLLEYQPL